MSQNTHESKKRKHMLDSAQYGLEIIFKLLNGQGKKKLKKETYRLALWSLPDATSKQKE